MADAASPAERMTVPAALEQAARTPWGITFVTEKGGETVRSYAELLQRAREVASALDALGVRRGDRIALALPSEEEFVTTFFGILVAGAVAVPLAPPLGIGKLDSFLESAARMLATAGATLFVTSKSIRAVAGTLRERAPSLRGITTCADLRGPALVPDRVVGLADLAMLQFTSGSTAQPKGVMLTHDNLAANCSVVVQYGLDARTPDRCVSWLPLFHDMGTIGFVLCPTYSQIPVVLMPPTLFAAKPAMWLKLLARHKGTITYAPNFAYAYAAKRIRDSELEGVDLTHVRVLGCGAEPIHADTLRTFVQRFQRYGIREHMYVPSYGMAESSVAISFGHGVRTDRVRVDDLETSRRAVVASADDALSSRELVACGAAFPGHHIRIVDADTETVLGDRAVGEIRIAGPSVTAGYFGDAEATWSLFDRDGYLRTGDLGYFADGQLHICGRKKDLIIIRGRNCAPQDLEWEAAKVDGVRPGSIVAFGVPSTSGDTESVVIVAERKKGADPGILADAIRARLLSEHGLAIAAVEIVDPGTIPKTTSGKLRRSDVRRQYLDGTLRRTQSHGVPGALRHLFASQWGHLKSAVPFRSPSSRE